MTRNGGLQVLTTLTTVDSVGQSSKRSATNTLTLWPMDPELVENDQINLRSLILLETRIISSKICAIILQQPSILLNASDELQ